MEVVSYNNLNSVARFMDLSTICGFFWIRKLSMDVHGCLWHPFLSVDFLREQPGNIAYRVCIQRYFFRSVPLLEVPLYTILPSRTLTSLCS